MLPGLMRMNLSVRMSDLTVKGASNSLLKNINPIAKRFKHEYAPRFKIQQKKQKGRVPVRTGGSIKGSTIQFGKYGLRLKSEGIRITAQQLKEADNAIMRYVRPLTNGHLWRRLCTNVAVCVKGNETRMGKGKGGFDHWMVRVPTGKVLFEINGDDLHEKVAREAFRKAGTKLPGVYEFISLDSLVRVGLRSFKNLKDDPVKNFYEENAKKPSKKYLNVLKSQEPQYKLFRGR
ncbi:mitochondrial ribosomal large subunit component [Saccharomyces pastorianus]|uniref:Mitochondrial ribosomal large subunit component n=2 Tax=Saccharomyces TaxID=4930 RepID=A0A6C1E1W9_SACPS|nr:mitochondrial ribosomal large subunit component [Saccharomyces pastorianus]